MNELIGKNLIEFAQHDLTVKERLLKEDRLSPGYNLEMEKAHRSNA